MTQFCVPMLESERGWGQKIDGYSGPFDTLDAANAFRKLYNETYNNEENTPDWYIMALEPVVYRMQRCEYKMTVADKSDAI